MFNIGDLVYQRAGRKWGLGVIMEMNDRSIQESHSVYAYKIQFAVLSTNVRYNQESICHRWLLEQDIILVEEAKRNV